MYNNKSILAIIPARGGSKGVPRKNIVEVGGKPLIAWTITEAQKSRYIDRLILSSDDDEIVDVAKFWGCEVPFVRPESLAKDDTPGVEPVLHAISAISEKYDYVLLLQPTSPLRTVEDIDGCIELCITKRANACISVSEPDKSPYWTFSVDDNGKLQPLMEDHKIYTQRQLLPQTYYINGALYIAKSDWIIQSKAFISPETFAYKMPPKRSIDIDTKLDIDFLNFLSAKGDI